MLYIVEVSPPKCEGLGLNVKCERETKTLYRAEATYSFPSREEWMKGGPNESYTDDSKCDSTGAELLCKQTNNGGMFKLNDWNSVIETEIVGITEVANLRYHLYYLSKEVSAVCKARGSTMSLLTLTHPLNPCTIVKYFIRRPLEPPSTVFILILVTKYPMHKLPGQHKCP